MSIVKPFFWGLLSASLLLGIYFLVVSLISGFGYAQEQFRQFWYFITGLSAGFGVEAGLYVHIKEKARLRHVTKNASGKPLAVSGATTTMAMLSCCSHYLVNILPLVGMAGIFGFLGQYQVEFFWLGLFFNAMGIAYLVKKIYEIH